MANGRVSKPKVATRAGAPARTPLPAELERRIAAKLRNGLYASQQEVLAEALRLLEERDRLFGPRLTALRRDVGEAIRSLDSNQAVSASEAFGAARRRAKVTRRRAG
jgi:putative addiction module CopG family antidote